MARTGSVTDYAELDGEIWLDGQWVDWQDAKVHVVTHGLHYGTGVFEGVRAYNTPQGPAAFRLHDHTERLFRSAHAVNLEIPHSPEELNAVQLEAVRRQGLDEAYIRPLVYLGTQGVGLKTAGLEAHAMVAAWAWPSYHDPAAMERGLKLITASIRRPSGDAMMHQAKATGNYLNAVLARHEATVGGFDEALMLDANGLVAEATGENIFLVRDGRLSTPPPVHCLDGITRRTILTLAREMGYPVEERTFSVDELYVADEVFLTGTAAEVMPVAELDGRPIGTGGRGPITEKLQKLYLDTVRGAEQGHADWRVLVGS